MKRQGPPMKNPRGILVAFALIALAASLSAQSFLVRTFEENDGLLSTAVNDLAQDTSGRMWFSTRGGLTIYDGAFWTSYTTANGLTALSTFQLRSDGRGSMWVIGQNPDWVLMRFDGKAWTSFPIPINENQPYNLTSMAVRPDTDGVFVAVGTAGAGVFVFDGSRWEAFSSTRGLPGDMVRGLDILNNGFLVATNKGLAWIGINGVESRWENSDPLLRGDIRGVSVEPTPEGDKIWVLGGDGLGVIRGGRFELILRESLAVFNKVYSTADLLPDGQGGLFYGNSMGIYYYDEASRSAHPLGVLSGLIAEGATSLFQDREKNIWIAGLRGVSRISSRRFFNYRKVDGLLDDEVSAIRPFGDSGIAFGHNNGISILKGRELKQVVFSRKPSISSRDVRVLDMAPDDEGGLWVAAGALGLGYLARDGRFRWIDFPLAPSEAVTSVVSAPGNRLWVTSSTTLFQFVKGRASDSPPAGFRDSYIRKIVTGPEGRLFVCTVSHGLFRWDGKTWADFTNTAESGAANVYSVLADSSGRTLVGTLAGLFRVSGEGLSRFTENGFEIRRPVYLILEDKAGRLWFGTDNGVVRWDGRTHRDFSKAEGLAGREVNRAAGMIDAMGGVWIGTNGGASCYQERYDLDPKDIPPPLISITNLDVNGKPADFSKELTLGYEQDNLVFHFLGTSFIDETRLRFESRLDGFDQTWSPEYAAVDRQIRYTNLPPGTYVFHLRAKNALGTMSESISSPVIRIRNAFWLQWWFIASVILLGGGLIISLGLAVTQHRQAERLEALVLDRTAQIQTSLREKEILLKEIHHRVKNNLQIISSLLNLEAERVSPDVREIIKRSQTRIRSLSLVHEKLYRVADLTRIDLAGYIETLAGHLFQVYVVDPGQVKLETDFTNVTLDINSAIPCGLILNELISNALKHAFPDGRKGVLTIGMRRIPDDFLELQVSDDGVGLPAAFDFDNPKSFGFQIMKLLVEQLEADFTVDRTRGTTFTVKFRELKYKPRI